MVLSRDSRDAKLDDLGHCRDLKRPYSGLKGLDEKLVCRNAMGQELEMHIELSLLGRKSMVRWAIAEVKDEHSP